MTATIVEQSDNLTPFESAPHDANVHAMPMKSVMKVKTHRDSIGSRTRRSERRVSLAGTIGRRVSLPRKKPEGPLSTSHRAPHRRSIRGSFTAGGKTLLHLLPGHRHDSESAVSVDPSPEKGTTGKKHERRESVIRFHEVHVRLYRTEVSINPAVSKGPAISLCWEYEAAPPVKVDEYEASQPRRKKLKELKLTPQERAAMLEASGVSKREMKAAIKATNIARRKRVETLETLRQSALHERIEHVKHKLKRKLKMKKSDEEAEADLWRNAEAYFLTNC